MSITSHDVARLAGVSQPTVSRALRDQPGVSPQTRARVRSAARQLGHVTMQTGRALATRQTSKIGIVSAELSNPFYPALLGPLHAAFVERGYRTTLFTDRADEPFEAAPLLDGSLDGAVLTTSRTDSALPGELLRRGVPFVMVNRTVDGARGDSCFGDNVAGGREVADFMVRLGHRRIGAIMGPEETSTGRDRTLGFRARLLEAGVAWDPARLVRGPFAAETGHAALRELMRATRPPTAIFCGNDVIALGALNAASELGIAVPEQLTLVGFDNIPMSSWPIVGLTTMSVDLGEMAASAAGLLVSRMQAPSTAPRHRVIDPLLVLRRTHAPPPAGS